MSSACRLATVACALCAVLLFACVPTANAQAVGDDDLSRIATLIYRGNCDGAIDETTALIQRSVTPDPRLLYLRGYALWELARFAESEKDLAGLGDLTVVPGWQSADALLRRVRQLQGLSPQVQRDVSINGRVAFQLRSYFDDDWTKAVLAQLPGAFNAVKAVLGVESYGTTVMIFPDVSQYQSFYDVYAPGYLNYSYEWCNSNAGLITFCEARATTERKGWKLDSDYFRGMGANRYTRSVLQRLLGRNLPAWLNEGLGMVVASHVAPTDAESNDKRMRTVVAKGGVLTMDQMDSYQTIWAIGDPDRSNLPPGFEQLHDPDPWAQAYHMTRFLWTDRGATAIRRLLDLYIKTDKFDESFKQTYGITVAQFYDAWLKDALSTAAKPAP